MTDAFEQVATLAELPPGKMKCVNVHGTRVLLANAAGTIFAADEMCTHEDASLCLGSLRGELVKCPLHGSRFNLRTGVVLDEPAHQPLRIHDVKVDGQSILVKLKG